MCGVVVNIIRRGVLKNFTGFHHDDGIGNSKGFFLVMGNVEGADPDFLNQLSDLTLISSRSLASRLLSGSSSRSAAAPRRGSEPKRSVVVARRHLRRIASSLPCKPTNSSAERTFWLISSFFSFRNLSPKATLLKTVMCGQRAVVLEYKTDFPGVGGH